MDDPAAQQPASPSTPPAPAEPAQTPAPDPVAPPPSSTVPAPEPTTPPPAPESPEPAPQAPSPQPESAPAVPASSAPQTGPADRPVGAKQKILIVEDDQDTREIYQEILKDAGYEVDVAVDGQEGLTKAEAGGFNLILLDVMMPKVDGLTFLNQYKQKDLTSKNGPIILFTNLSHDPVIKEALSLGAKSFLVKSEFSPDQVVEKVKGFLQG